LLASCLRLSRRSRLASPRASCDICTPLRKTCSDTSCHNYGLPAQT
jgi:hypothetical protein